MTFKTRHDNKLAEVMIKMSRRATICSPPISKVTPHFFDLFLSIPSNITYILQELRLYNQQNSSYNFIMLFSSSCHLYLKLNMYVASNNAKRGDIGGE